MKISLNADDWTKDYAPQLGQQTAAAQPLTYSDQAAVNRALVRLTEKSDALAKALQDGTPPTIEAYREMAGELRGIRYAIDTVRTAEREVSGGESMPKTEMQLYAT